MKEIEAMRVDGKFLGPDGNVASGSDEVEELLQRCLRWVDVVLEKQVYPVPMCSLAQVLTA